MYDLVHFPLSKFIVMQHDEYVYCNWESYACLCLVQRFREQSNVKLSDMAKRCSLLIPCGKNPEPSLSVVFTYELGR